MGAGGAGGGAGVVGLGFGVVVDDAGGSVVELDVLELSGVLTLLLAGCAVVVSTEEAAVVFGGCCAETIARQATRAKEAVHFMATLLGC